MLSPANEGTPGGGCGAGTARERHPNLPHFTTWALAPECRFCRGATTDELRLGSPIFFVRTGRGRVIPPFDVIGPVSPRAIDCFAKRSIARGETITGRCASG